MPVKATKIVELHPIGVCSVFESLCNFGHHKYRDVPEITWHPRGLVLLVKILRGHRSSEIASKLPEDFFVVIHVGGLCRLLALRICSLNGFESGWQKFDYNSLADPAH